MCFLDTNKSDFNCLNTATGRNHNVYTFVCTVYHIHSYKWHIWTQISHLHRGPLPPGCGLLPGGAVIWLHVDFSSSGCIAVTNMMSGQPSPKAGYH